MSDIVLIGCVRGKLAHRAPAQRLYTSPLFRKRQSYAARSGKPWFILSAKHGLLTPDELVEPYDMKLTDMDALGRAWWGLRVARELELKLCPRHVLQDLVVEIHAAAAYLQALDSLEDAGARIEAPLAGLGIGQQLAWYGQEAA